MQIIDTVIKHPSEIWRDDKNLVRLSHPDLRIDWNAQLPSNQDAHSILVKRSEQWLNPAEPFQLDEKILAEALGFLIPEVENVFDDKLKDRPAIEVLPKDRYLPRINELERETNKQFGYGSLCRSPPTMFHSPTNGILLMPEKYLVRVPRGQSWEVTSGDFDVRELTWDRSFFEEVLCEELSHVLFRQLRGEWKRDYVRAMKAIGPQGEEQVSSINETMAQHVKENIARHVRKQWSLYVASEKISLVWGNRDRMNDYLCVDALARDRNLAQVAMVDYVLARSQKELHVLFNHSHPNYILKEERFNETNK